MLTSRGLWAVLCAGRWAMAESLEPDRAPWCGSEHGIYVLDALVSSSGRGVARATALLLSGCQEGELRCHLSSPWCIEDTQ